MTDPLNELNQSVLEAKIDRNNYWKILFTLRQEYINEKVDMSFADWVEKTHGFSIIFRDGMIAEGYDITDEAKYTFFILKYK